MNTTHKVILRVGILAAGLLILSQARSQAGVIILENAAAITSTSPLRDAVADKIKVVITDEAVDLSVLFPGFSATPTNTVAAPGGASQVNFIFVNLGTILAPGASITDVYWDDGSLLGIATLSGSSGVHYSTPATPANLPGGNNANPDFVATASFSADSDSPIVANGIQANEWLSVKFNLIGGQDFSDTAAALLLGGAEGGLRVGAHVQNIGGVSDSFLIVPEPSSFVLCGLGLIGLVGLRRRSK